MRILLVSSLTPNTGNRTTALRIAAHLERGGHRVRALHVYGDETPGAVRDRAAYELGIAIHAYRAGRLFVDVGAPFVVIFGGTDVNEHSRDAEKRAEMARALEQAALVIAFNAALLHKADGIWGGAVAPKARVVMPAIEPPPADARPGGWRAAWGIPRDAFLLILPCGVRPVKAPTWLSGAIELHNRAVPAAPAPSKETGAAPAARVYLVIVGPVLDQEFADAMQREISAHYPHTKCYDALRQPDLYAAIRESDAVANTSVSEGLSNVVLETMHLGVPLLVRDILGNTAVVKDGETGVVISDPAELPAAVRRLRDPAVRKRLTERARAYVTSEHSFTHEQELYCAAVDAAMGAARAAAGPGDADR